MIRLPSAADPAVSLIVLLDGTAELGERCLQAIAATNDAVPCETVILLNDPSSSLEKMVREATTGGRVIVSRANAGPGVGWNLGAAVARAPRLATLHEDSEPDAGWLEPLCEVMTESGAGAVGSRLYNGDGSVQNCGWVLFSDASHQQIDATTAPGVTAASDPTPADMLSGAAMLLDRDVLRGAGGWDERFHPAVFVDIDISTASWSQGRAVLSVPASRVRHQSGAFDRRPNSAVTGPRLRPFLFERHRDHFLAKWGPAVSNLATPPADAEPENVRTAVQSALMHTRERLVDVQSGSGSRARSPAKAELCFSGVAEPVLEEDDGVYAVASEIEASLAAAEVTLVDEYCRWLVSREQELIAHYEGAHKALDHREQIIDELRGHVTNLQRGHRELEGRLNGILNGRTWRLRNLVFRILQRIRVTFVKTYQYLLRVRSRRGA